MLEHDSLECRQPGRIEMLNHLNNGRRIETRQHLVAVRQRTMMQPNAIPLHARQPVEPQATMGDFERKEFHAALRNQVLEADKFPTIKFTSVSVSNVQRDGDKRSFTLNGDLTIHGTTKRVSFPVNATISNNELRATGEEKFKQTEFGLKPFEKGLGLIKIGDELKVAFNIVAKMQ